MKNVPASIAFVLVLGSLPATSADIVLTPPAAGGVSVTNAAGNATRLRVGEDGAITMPGLGPVPIPSTSLCVSTNGGQQVGTCAPLATGVTNVGTGTGLTGGPITTTGTISIAPAGVTSLELGSSAVQSAHIGNNQVTLPKMAAGVLPSIAALAGSIPANIAAVSSVYVFVGPTTSVTITPTDRMTGSGVIAVATSPGLTTSADIGFCFQQGANPITNFHGGTYVTVEIDSVRRGTPVVGSVNNLTAGTYTVGACIRNLGANVLNDNDFMNAWIMVTH